MGRAGGDEVRFWPHGRSSIDQQVSSGPETKIWTLGGFFEELTFQLISPVTAEAPPREVCGPGRWRTYGPNQVAGQPPWALGAIARPVGGTGGGDTGPPRCPSEAWSEGWPLVRRRGYPGWSGGQAALPTDTLRLNPPAARRPHTAHRARARSQKGHTLTQSQKGECCPFRIRAATEGLVRGDIAPRPRAARPQRTRASSKTRTSACGHVRKRQAACGHVRKRQGFTGDGYLG